MVALFRCSRVIVEPPVKYMSWHMIDHLYGLEERRAASLNLQMTISLGRNSQFAASLTNVQSKKFPFIGKDSN